MTRFRSGIVFKHSCILAGELCRSKKIFFHTDAAQAIGKVKVNVEEQKIDLLSISGHKIYGPKGNRRVVS